MTSMHRRSIPHLIDRFFQMKYIGLTIIVTYDKDTTRQGYISLYLDETGDSITVRVIYSSEDKILTFYASHDLETRVNFYKLINFFRTHKKAPKIKACVSPQQLKVREKFKDNPCPNIYINPREWDILIHGFFYNPRNPYKTPWEGKYTIKLWPGEIKNQVGKLTQQLFEFHLRHLIKKGLIIKMGKNWNTYHTTKDGNLVIRREILGG